MFRKLRLTPSQTALSTQLYYTLVICKERAFDLAVNCGNGEGFMAWNSLCKEFCPKLQSRYVSIYSCKSLPSTLGTISNVASGVAAFEKLIREYETQSDG